MSATATSAAAFADGYHEVAPPPALRGHVECFWVARGASGPQRILPDGCVDFLFDAASGGHGARLVGAMTRPCAVAAATSRELVAVRFHPGGAGAFVPAPLHEVTDADLDLAAFGPHWRELATAGLHAGDPCRRLLAVQRWLLGKLPAREDAFAGALRRFAAGDQRVDAAAAGLGCSRQHFAREVRARTGLSPKLLARIRRLRRALADAGPAVAVALRHGYADQAHFARDVKDLTGRSRSELHR